MKEWIPWGNGGGDRRRIVRRELLHTGNNGHPVERIWLSEGESFIRKPLTNDAQAGLERWVYENVLPSLPPIYPRLIGCSPEREEGGGWLLFEDLGPLDHSFRESTARELVKRIAEWHRLPAERWANAPLSGPKPAVNQMVRELLDSAKEEKERKWLREAEARMAELGEWGRRPVLSHGDLHPGNFAVAGGRIRVLDWEHAHLNSPYWDLYHAIDLSHPLHPRGPIVDSVRAGLLQAYAEEAARLGDGLIPEKETFLREYRLFAAVFSLWMLKLIEKDLREDRGIWPTERLRGQRLETLAVWERCSTGAF
ncbi:phosphotransferase family protein [Cohnella zeiphila]|uniref:Aminoglycoside phosphotransferase family protein n=1 Tax=Cohnella zeiphila TaxID=2761120 RepID=A0A7X0SN90_9BACL|nr:aminoglycoside phosphotransferase family protein [Cohnella zeiphila]MBB6733130.1 aminoglycoside phosphotransferase family protein [Cohnella zeiphila]